MAALKRTAAGKLEQPGRQRGRACVEFAVELARSSGSVCWQRPTRSRAIRTCVVCSRRASWRPSRSSQTAAVECTERHRDCRVELVQVPAQPLLAAAPLRDQVVAVVDEQLQLAQRLLAGTGTVQ